MRGLILILAAVALARAENLCPPEQSENWEIELLLPHPQCNKFYKCTFGQPVEMVCYGNLYFNLKTWQCDWPENVECGDRIDPADTTTASPTPTTLVPETTTNRETEAPITTPIPTTTETTTAEVTTTTTQAPTTPTLAPTTTTEVPTTTTQAPTTTTLAPTTTTEVPTTTTQAPTTTQEPDTEPPTTTAAPTVAPTPEPEPEKPEIDFLENGCPVNPHIHWLLPHEGNCNLFYYCVWGRKVLRHCPSTLHFNKVIQVCDWPWDAGCASSFDKNAVARRMISEVEVSVNL
ncbi:insect intestinal mucin precursor [Bombyx mori]|uniref:Insect intestinal mucin n=1 Tax=Bombyx mori TaxID=7091 RepID=G1FU07_BOMMO|nr:insect intestinal mucin precursor [Bombyx mori]AEM36337.1 insect intestinal mucin [Bombyx mori]